MAQRPSNKVDQEIDRNLKRAFDEMSEEPLPDRLMQLINRLREEDTQQAGDKTGNSAPSQQDK